LVAAYYCEGPLDKKEGGNLPGGVPYALRVGEGTPVQKGWPGWRAGGGLGIASPPPPKLGQFPHDERRRAIRRCDGRWKHTQTKPGLSSTEEKAMKSNKKKKSRETPSESGSADISWADLPAEKVAVDLAHQAASKPASRKRARSRKGAVDDDEVDEFDTQLWKSEHYDGEDEATNAQQVDQDLFDPNPEHKTNKFDAGNTFDGAHDAGMFYR